MMVSLCHYPQELVQRKLQKLKFRKDPVSEKKGMLESMHYPMNKLTRNPITESVCEENVDYSNHDDILTKAVQQAAIQSTENNENKNLQIISSAILHKDLELSNDSECDADNDDDVEYGEKTVDKLKRDNISDSENGDGCNDNENDDSYSNYDCMSDGLRTTDLQQQHDLLKIKRELKRKLNESNVSSSEKSKPKKTKKEKLDPTLVKSNWRDNPDSFVEFTLNQQGILHDAENMERRTITIYHCDNRSSANTAHNFIEHIRKSPSFIVKNYTLDGEPFEKSSDGKITRTLGGKTVIILIPIISDNVDDVAIYNIRKAMNKHNAGAAILICDTQNLNREVVPYSFKTLIPSKVEYVKNDINTPFELPPTVDELKQFIAILNNRIEKLEEHLNTS